ncbi:MAG: hypothetical protein PUF52_08610, partial [Prevotella sp.]|nr:hypothetical protein [Prevotella sp.]
TGFGTTGVADVKSEEQETATASARFFTFHFSLFTLHFSLFTKEKLTPILHSSFKRFFILKKIPPIICI